MTGVGHLLRLGSHLRSVVAGLLGQLLAFLVILWGCYS